MIYRTAMHTEVTIVLVESLKGGDVRRPFYDLIHPFYGPHHLVSFFLSEDWWTLVFCNLTLRTKHVHSGDTVGTQRRTEYLILPDILISNSSAKASHSSMTNVIFTAEEEVADI